MSARSVRTESGVWPDRWLLEVLGGDGRVGAVDPETLAQTGAATVWEAYERAGVATSEEILAVVADRFSIPVAVPSDLDPEAAPQLPESFAREHRIVPLRTRGRVLHVASSDPLNAQLESAVSFRAGQRVVLELAAPSAIEAMQRRLYPGTEAVDEAVRSLVPRSRDPVLRRLTAPAGEPVRRFPIVELMDALIGQAIRRRASDIHVEPDLDSVSVRYRIDGVLHPVTHLPPDVLPPIVSRVKVMAGLDIADRLRPQDGRGEARIDGRRVDLRISTMPVGTLGEKVVIRILDTGSGLKSLAELGFSPPELRRVERLFLGDAGLVLVTGPTGSGKTTTLYSGLRAMKRSAINIVTVEDPIEYRLSGIAQVQVNESIGLSFSTALRSLLRQDPDVMLVGEIRDADTAEIGVQASLTGHRVLTTLHTPDAPSTVSRLLGLGVDRDSLASALKGVVAQRLIRRLCPECRTPVSFDELPAAQRALLRKAPDAKLYQARGCRACADTGYLGQMVIAQVAIVTPTVARAIGTGVTEEELTRVCRAAGMRSLWESGLERVAAGETTIDELVDTVPPPMDTVDPESLDDEHRLTQVEVDALIESIRTAATSDRRTADPASGDGVSVNGINGVNGVGGIKGVAAGGDDEAIRDRGDLATGPVTLTGRPRILLADDDAAVRDLFRRSLERAGAEVVEASDGELALEYLEVAEFDLTLLDLTMPKEDGFGVLAAMRQGRAQHVPVLIVTGSDDPEVAAWALEMGAADVVTKPVAPRELTDRVARQLRLQPS